MRSCEYYQEFAQSKTIYPDIYEHQSFAWDTIGFVSVNTTYFVPTNAMWLTPVLNSLTIEWFYSQISNRVRGGYLRAFTDYMRQVPVPAADSAQQSRCERLADGIIWLHSLTGNMAAAGPVGLMIAYLEQWLNGLVYELFFANEMHAHTLKLFDETKKLKPPDLSKLRAADELSALRELHQEAYATDATLREMLFDLKSLDAVRVIEDAGRSDSHDEGQE